MDRKKPDGFGSAGYAPIGQHDYNEPYSPSAPPAGPVTSGVVDAGVYNHGIRSYTDTMWRNIFVLVQVASVALAIYGSTSYNKNFSEHVTEEHLAKFSSCNGGAALGLEAAASGDNDPEVLSVPEFLDHAKYWLIISFIIAGCLGIFFLNLFKYHAELTLKVVIGLKILAPAVVGLVLLSYSPMIALINFAVSGLMALVFYLWRDKLRMCGKLLALSAHGLKENPNLAFFVILLKLSTLIILVPHMVGLTFAGMSGHPFPNSGEVVTHNGETCKDSDDMEVACCVWKMDDWAVGYFIFGAVCILWTLFLAFDLRLYTVSGTITQWYYAPPGTRLQGSMMSSLKNGLGPNFGSLCFGSFVMTIVEILRKANEQARRNAMRRGGVTAIIACICTSCMDCLYAVIQFLSKFAVIQMAITGESFCDAARSVTDLLKRNFLSAYAVWWLPPMILHTVSFLLAAVWGALAGVLSYNTFPDDKLQLTSAIVLGFIAFGMSLTVMSFFNSLLLNIVDAVFICYAMDKDRATVCNAAAHEIFMIVPVAVGPVVQQPDGNIGYAPPPQVTAP